MAIGITGWTTNRGPYTVRPNRDANAFSLLARQSGQQTSYSWSFQATCPTGARLLAESAGSSEFVWRVYPNPTVDEVSVETNADDAQLTVYSADGRLLPDVVVTKKAGTAAALRLDLSAYPMGMYLIRLQTGQQSAVQRVIKW